MNNQESQESLAQELSDEDLEKVSGGVVTSLDKNQQLQQSLQTDYNQAVKAVVGPNAPMTPYNSSSVASLSAAIGDQMSKTTVSMRKMSTKDR